jgi:Second Messenger Oligonucleotide or Dinucleotide Synthetase domain
VNHERSAPGARTPGASQPEVAETVSDAFTKFDRALNLDTREREQALQLYRRVQEVLVAASVAVDTFLQGSFARKTMLAPLKDVDIVVILPVRLRHLLERSDGPSVAMALLRSALEPAFPGIRFDGDDAPAKALRVSLAGVTFTLDLVVAFDSPVRQEWVRIGNRETGEWESSNTRVLNRLIRTRNQATGGVWVHQARMLKSFKTGDPVLGEHCGLLFESILHEAVTRRMSHPRALASVLAHGASVLRGPVWDPTHEDDLTADWTSEERADTVDAFAAAAKTAAEALALADAGDELAAVAEWSELLGDPFPAAPPRSVDAVLRDLNGGSITTSGHVSRSAAGREPARPARSWRSH